MTHSSRIGTCVCLHAAGIDAETIQHTLRWMSMAFKQYLRNIPAIANHCTIAICTFDPDCLDIILMTDYSVLATLVTP